MRPDFLDGTHVIGIDVNKYRGNFPFGKAREGLGISFAYIRMSGTASHTRPEVEIDPRGAKYRKEARAEGLLTGSYHGLTPGVGPREQAVVFYEALTKSQAFFDELPPAIDVELPKTDRALLEKFLVEFWSMWETKTVIYTSQYKWHSLIGADYRASKLSPSPWLWVADYRDRKTPALPNAWDNWLLWQFTSKGKFPGYESVVDLNVWNGTLEDLEAHCESR